MNIREAEDLIIKIEQKSVTSAEDEFQLVEALLFLFNETHTTKPILYLGGYYYGSKRFDLALKYYEMASDLGCKQADLCLGYVWYYGRTGQRDYEKAYKCFSNVMDADIGNDMDKGQVSKDDQTEASLKIADMYKNGYFVSKDYDEYKRIIINLYNNMPKINKEHDVFKKYVEVGLRMARIYEEEGKTDEAIELYYMCRYDLAVRLSYNPFFGDFNQMDWTINDIYRLTTFDKLDFDLYDLFYLLKEEHTVEFIYKNKPYIIESKKGNDSMSYRFVDRWYRSFNDLLLKESIDNESLPFLYGNNLLERWALLR